MSSVVGFLLSIRGALDAFFVVAVWCWLKPLSVVARRAVLIVAVGYALIGIYAVPHFIARGWDAGYHRFEQSDAPAGVTAIVLLGAGAERVNGWDDEIATLSPVGAARVLEAYRVFKLISPAWIISSGGVVHPTDSPREPSSETMRTELVSLGVPRSRIMVESASRDTHDEAVVIAPMLQTLGVDHVVLVTSDIHMRRSMGTFRASGILAVPAIAPDPNLSMNFLRWYTPTDEGLKLSNDLVHELLGIPYYWTRGWWRSS